jgi:hypothetical protein
MKQGNYLLDPQGLGSVKNEKGNEERGRRCRSKSNGKISRERKEVEESKMKNVRTR